MNRKTRKTGGARAGAGRKPRATPAACYTISIDKEDANTVREHKLHGEIRECIKVICERVRNAR